MLPLPLAFLAFILPYSGEELTLDYATFLDARMEPFACHCGALNFMGWQGSFQLTLNDQQIIHWTIDKTSENISL